MNLKVGVALTQASLLLLVHLFVLIIYIPVNNFSVMSGHIFPGWTNTKQRIKCLCSRTQCNASSEARTATPRSRVKHSTTSSVLVHGDIKVFKLCLRMFLNKPAQQNSPTCRVADYLTNIGWQFKGVRALRGYFGPPMRSKNKSCSSQVSSY